MCCHLQRQSVSSERRKITYYMYGWILAMEGISREIHKRTKKFLKSSNYGEKSFNWARRGKYDTSYVYPTIPLVEDIGIKNSQYISWRNYGCPLDWH